MNPAPIIVEQPFAEPVDVAMRFAGRRRLAFLHSAMPHETLGRWSYVAADPFGVFSVRDGVAFWNDEALGLPPMEALRACLARHATPRVAGGPPFQGGAIGHLAYEAGHLFEKLPFPDSEGEPLLQVELAFYDRLVAIDSLDRRLFVIAPPGATLEIPAAPTPLPAPPRVADWHDSRTRAAFETEVATVIEAIRNGDIFQVNLAHRFSGRPDGPPDALATYLALARANPAPFSALLVDGARFIASTSPERFLKLAGRAVETRPIKGTTRRAADAATDRANADWLAQSDKDRAENTMIVDLLRNDLSRVCEPGSVDVPVLCAIETYASVHHLVSVVTGRLEPDKTVIDLIAATFPGGSITGAPKIKAMEIITRLEREPRGPYCGAIGYIGFDGDADLNIAIRTLVCDGEHFSLHAGGGITLLSDPASEYDETLAKAERILGALGRAP